MALDTAGIKESNPKFAKMAVDVGHTIYRMLARADKKGYAVDHQEAQPAAWHAVLKSVFKRHKENWPGGEK